VIPLSNSVTVIIGSLTEFERKTRVLCVHFIWFLHLSLTVLHIYYEPLLMHLCTLLSTQTEYVKLFYAIVFMTNSIMTTTTTMMMMIKQWWLEPEIICTIYNTGFIFNKNSHSDKRVNPDKRLTQKRQRLAFLSSNQIAPRHTHRDTLIALVILTLIQWP